MMHELPKEPAKIRQRIRRYELAFEKELDEKGCYDDGAGKRFLLAPLYLVMGDLSGALKSFDWYASKFPDDMHYPGHRMCWALALYRDSKEQAASQKLGQAMLENLYILPKLLDDPIERLDIWHGCNIAEPEHLDYVPPEFFDIWTMEERGWARKLYGSERFTRARTKYIDIGRQLLREPPGPGPRRTELVERAFELERCFDQAS